MADSVLLEERRDGVLLATLNRPTVLNALDSELRSRLAALWETLRDDPSLSVAIVTGNGRSFSTGRDLKETARAYGQGERVEYDQSGRYGYPSDIVIGKPVIAAINGLCMAGGLMLSLGCDIRLCSESATFANPQVKRGRGTIVPYVLARAGVPRAMVMDLALTGEPITAAQALQCGLVSRVVSDDELLATAWRIAGTIAANPQPVVRGVKRAVELGLLDLPPADARRLWDPLTDMMSDTPDAREGTVAFAQRSDAGRPSDGPA